MVAVGFLLVTNPVIVNAAGQVTGKDVKDKSLTGKDVKDNSLLSKDFKAGQLPAGAQGPVGPPGRSRARRPSLSSRTPSAT